MIDVEKIVRIMREVGVPDAKIIKFLELQNKVDLEVEAEKREANRIRQRNHRARNVSHSDARDTRDTVNALSSKKEVNLESKKERALTNSRGSFCPTDFTPSDSHYEAGSKLGLSRQQVDDQARAMVEWSTANRNRAVARKADWSLTFAGWLRRNTKPPATADPPETEAYREHMRRNAEINAERKARKNGTGETAGTNPTDGSGNQGTDHESNLFSEGAVFQPDNARRPRQSGD